MTMLTGGALGRFAADQAHGAFVGDVGSQNEEGDRNQPKRDAFLAFIGVAVPEPRGKADSDENGSDGLDARIDAEPDD